MHQASVAYGRVAQATQSPREVEATLLIKAATRMQTAKEAIPMDRRLFDEALTYNRKLWTLLVTSATKSDNPLPQAIKQNIANLGVFVLGRIFDLTVELKPQKIDILININREIAAGLRARQPEAEPAPSPA